MCKYACILTKINILIFFYNIVALMMSAPVAFDFSCKIVEEISSVVGNWKLNELFSIKCNSSDYC